MCILFCNSFYGIELYNFNKDSLKMYIQHGVNVCELYFVFVIPLIIILFSHLYYNIMERLHRRLVMFILNLLHTNNSNGQSIVDSKLLLYPNSMLSENYIYPIYKYKMIHLDWKLSLLHVLNKI